MLNMMFVLLLMYMFQLHIQYMHLLQFYYYNIQFDMLNIHLIQKFFQFLFLLFQLGKLLYFDFPDSNIHLDMLYKKIILLHQYMFLLDKLGIQQLFHHYKIIQ